MSEKRVRLPTEKQYRTLLTLGNGNMVVSGGDRSLRAMTKRGWLEPDLPKFPDNGFRITPAGIRVLADAVEKYGLPSLKWKPEQRPVHRFSDALRKIRMRGCTDCSEIAREALYPAETRSESTTP